MASVFREISYSEYSSGFISILIFCLETNNLFPRVCFVPENLGLHRNDPNAPQGNSCFQNQIILEDNRECPQWPVGQCVVFEQCRSVSYPRKLCSAPSQPPFLCMRPVCRHHLVPLGGLHSVKGNGCGSQNSEVGYEEIPFWKSTLCTPLLRKLQGSLPREQSSQYVDSLTIPC